MRSFILLIIVLHCISDAKAQKLDVGFGQGGVIISPFGKNVWSRGRKIAVQSDGKILVALDAYFSKVEDLVIMRYHPNGVIDSSFGVDGMIKLDSEGYNQIRNLIPLPDNRFLISIVSYNSLTDSSNVFLRRYLPYGQLDSSFGAAGVVKIKGFGGYAVRLENGDIIVSLRQKYWQSWGYPELIKVDSFGKSSYLNYSQQIISGVLYLASDASDKIVAMDNGDSGRMSYDAPQI